MTRFLLQSGCILAWACVGCGPDQTAEGESSTESEHASDSESETDTDTGGQDGPCEFAFTSENPAPPAPDDPNGCLGLDLPDCADNQVCRVVELGPVTCDAGQGCVSADREFVRCMPFEVICKPNSGQLVCEVGDNGEVGAPWVRYDACETLGFALCETTAAGLPNGDDVDPMLCD